MAGTDVDALEAWELYTRKAANDARRSRLMTPPREWFTVFERRMRAYRDRWEAELGDYLPVDVPRFADFERRIRRQLTPVLAAAKALAR